MSVFYSVPGVPRKKMERFGGFTGVVLLWLLTIPATAESRLFLGEVCFLISHPVYGIPARSHLHQRLPKQTQGYRRV